MRPYENLYSKLFSTPSALTSFSISAGLAVILSIFDRVFAYYWITLVLSLILATKIINLKFNMRRIFFFVFILLITGFLSRLFEGSIVATFFLFLSTIYFCSDSSLLSKIIYSTIVYLILDPSESTLAILIFAISLLLIFLKLLDRKVGIFKVREFVEAFILFWLTSSPEYFEKPLTKVAEKFTGRVRCLRIGEARLISTDFHPGPFRNVGGAALASEILKIPNSVYLHSPTSHARNPVSTRETEKIVSGVRCNGEPLKPQKPFKVKGKMFEAICIPFDKLKLIFISGNNRIDDFIVDSNDFVVDCHNARVKGFDMSGEDIEEVKKLLEKVSKIKTDNCKLKYALIRERLKTESICGWVAVLLLDFEDQKFAIVMFDSNNVNLQFRKFVEERFAQIGIEAIVVSTDNHSNTGIRTKVGYKAAGDDERDWQIVEKLLERVSDTKPMEAECRYAENMVEAMVMGDNLLKDSEYAAERYSMFYIATFLFFAIFNFILTSIIL